MDGYLHGYDVSGYWSLLIPTSPMIPDFLSALVYMATGLVKEREFDKVIILNGLEEKVLIPRIFAQELNQIGLPGVSLFLKPMEKSSGSSSFITNMRAFSLPTLACVFYLVLQIDFLFST